MVAAQFEHTASRPDRATGYAAPQLHTHVVIFNMTQTEEGKTRSVQPLELYRSQRYATAIYRMHLAEKLQHLGYQVEVDARTGAPEIKGFSKEYLQESSPRREEVVREAEEMKERLERQSAVVKENARLKQAAARTDRASKRYDRAEMRQRALEMDVRHDNEARRSVEQAHERGPIHLSEEEIAKRAQEAVTFARDNAVEREAVADVRRVEVDALLRNLGLTTYEAIRTELAARQERAEFIPITRELKPRETTTRHMLQMELSNIRTMLDSQGQHPPVMSAERARDAVRGIGDRLEINLHDSQIAAIEQILTSRDQIPGLQGRAGTGKTTVLSILREAAQNEGYEVRGFAPTTRAAQQLAKSGIHTETLQKFLVRREEAPSNENRLFVLDESSLASTRNVNTFFSRLEAQDKVLLVGDIKQHQAVDAGSPFEQFQMNGMETAKLTKILRQRNPSLRQTVQKLSANQVNAAVASLREQGRVIEVKDESKRLLAIADAYCKNSENTLVISPANQERVLINSLIHRQLQRDGRVGPRDHPTLVLVNRQDMTGTERKFANSYVPDEDIVRYNRASKTYDVAVGDYARVKATEHGQNEITVQFEDGRDLTYNPQRLSGVSVYREAKRSFSEGDRIQFRAPFAQQGIANGELGAIEKIKDDKFTVVLESGKEVDFSVDEFRHIDHGYTVTSYSSQGHTVDRVFVNADTRESEILLNQRMGYVALSRAREDAIIFTNSADQLRAVLDRSVDKEMAVEALRQSQDRNALSQEEWERLVSPTNRATDEQSVDQGHMSNSSEDTTGDNRAATEEIEIELNSLRIH
jgi:ATP-dependent exoDNAse (exonuclease V) alpha subunit